MQYLATAPYFNPNTHTSCESLKNLLFLTASHLAIIKKTSTKKFLMVESVFNLPKVNTVPCMFTAALSLRQREHDWIVQSK